MENLELLKSDASNYNFSSVVNLIEEADGLNELKNELKNTFIFITTTLRPLVIDDDVITLDDFIEYQNHLFLLSNIIKAFDGVEVAK
jgi:hypothetical protein